MEAAPCAGDAERQVNTAGALTVRRAPEARPIAGAR